MKKISLRYLIFVRCSVHSTHRVSENKPILTDHEIKQTCGTSFCILKTDVASYQYECFHKVNECNQ